LITPPFFVVLGMHRSGTSCLTGALERCGVYLGDVRRTGKHNKRGYFEIRHLQQLHDEILEANNGAWYNPPLKVSVNDTHKNRLKEMFDELSVNSPSAIKDPRLLLIPEVWQEISGESYQPIGTFRHPIAVAKSLEKRNELSIEQGLELWKIYNTALVNMHSTSPFPIIHYDLSRYTHYFKTVVHLAKALKLKPQKVNLFFFISSRLEHQQSAALSVPADCQELYSYLLQNQFRIS